MKKQGAQKNVFLKTPELRTAPRGAAAAPAMPAELELVPARGLPRHRLPGSLLRRPQPRLGCRDGRGSVGGDAAGAPTPAE